MNRRRFLKIGSLALVTGALQGCGSGLSGAPNHWEINIHSDQGIGHLLMESAGFPVSGKFRTDLLIVGGGVAGLSAAYAAHQEGCEFTLFELSDQLGGTSRAMEWGGSNFAQGAHYDLAYPEYYGREVLSLLEAMNIIRFNNLSGLFEFADRQYCIGEAVEENVYSRGLFRDDVLPDDGNIRDQFYTEMEQFTGSMPMPTRLIADSFRHLNGFSFSEYLRQTGIRFSEEFIRGIDYQMLDDYGGTAAAVSALAGIHYHACRPYYSQPVPLFSPPQGNYYFVQKFLQNLPESQLKTGFLVKKIESGGKTLNVELIDTVNNRIQKWEADRVIYAGQKHALKYVYPDDSQLFNDIAYAPWMVMNLIFDDIRNSEIWWQNEILSPDLKFLGFVDADAQHSPNPRRRVLTAYYCLHESDRETLKNLNKTSAREWVGEVLDSIGAYFGSGDQLKNHLERVFINKIGHAMPIPKPGYLFQDGNDRRKNRKIVYAGVDNRRLPLFFEAVDSGLMAWKRINHPILQ